RNIQASWVKMGAGGVAVCLQAGANDFGGTMMNESITRAAGGINGQELTAGEMLARATAIGRPLAQRTTLYGPVLSRDALVDPGERKLEPDGPKLQHAIG